MPSTPSVAGDNLAPHVEFGLVAGGRVSITAGLQNAARLGRLDVLQSAFTSGAVCKHDFVPSVSTAAVEGGHVHVYRWCIESNWPNYNRIVRADLVESVRQGGLEQVDWALRTFPGETDCIAIGVSLSNMTNALDVYKRVDNACTARKGPLWYSTQLVHAFDGGDIGILQFIDGRMMEAFNKPGRIGGTNWPHVTGLQLQASGPVSTRITPNTSDHFCVSQQTILTFQDA